MGFLSKIFGTQKNQIDLNKTELIEADACPNCWGYQEYDGRFVSHNSGQTKSNIKNFTQYQKAFVQQFVEKYITGVQGTCPNCMSNI